MTNTEHETMFEREHVPSRLVAAHEIAAVERDWSAARALQDGNRLADLGREERIMRLGVHQAFYELIEIQGSVHDDAGVILELFAENGDLINATLDRIEMRGEWDVADSFERELLGLVYDSGYKGAIHRIARESDQARRSITIPAGFTAEHGYVALRRKRTLLVAEHFKQAAVRPRIEIDKVSTFALDIAALNKLSDPAAAEVRLIVAGTIYKAIDWGILEAGSQEDHRGFESAVEDLYNLTGIMDKYGITIEEIKHRMFETENPAELTDAVGLAFIEAALHERNSLLTPAATTYYVHS